MTIKNKKSRSKVFRFAKPNRKERILIPTFMHLVSARLILNCNKVSGLAPTTLQEQVQAIDN